MEMIKKLIRQEREEIADAEKYITCAMNYKERHPDMASIYYNLASDEVCHAETICGQIGKEVTTLINRASISADEEEKAEARAMEYVWAYESETLAEDMVRVKTKIASYR